MDGWRSGLININADLELATVLAKIDSGGYPSGQRGLTVNQLAEAFGGSNPSPPTRVKWLTGVLYTCQRVDEWQKALIAQPVEHVLGKNGVMGSNPIEGSRRQALI